MITTPVGNNTNKKIYIVMKKLFTFFAACMATVALFAAETEVWVGNTAISWDNNQYIGMQFDTHDYGDIFFPDMKAEDTIRVSISDVEEEAQFVLGYKAGDSWDWTDLEGTEVQGDTVIVYPIATDGIATLIKDRGLIVKGIYYHARRIVVRTKATTPDPEPDPETLQPGETKVLWEGEETLAWNEVAEQPASIGALLEDKDQIIVTVSAKGAADWPKVLLRDLSSTQVGNDILLNEVTEFPHEAVFILNATDVEALKDGFKLCGDGVTVTKMVLKKYEEPEPQPDVEYDFTAVWTGDKAISWNTEVYAGEQFDTYTQQQDMFAGIANGDSIKVFYADAVEGAEFAASYKAGDDWTWTDLAITQHDGFYAYRVASEEMAQWIADRGIVLRGQAYHAVRIEIGKPKNASGIESIQPSAIRSQKILRNGQVQIVRDGAIYNMLGQQIK